MEYSIDVVGADCSIGTVGMVDQQAELRYEGDNYPSKNKMGV